MNTSTAAGVRAPCLDTEREPARPRDEIAEMVFAALLSPQPSPLPPPASSCQSQPQGHAEVQAVASGEWRPAASPMTSPSASGGAGGNTLATTVESPELGRVSVEVVQSPEGLRVVVGAERPEVLRAMQAKAGILEAGLREAGLGAVQLSMVAASGITLARGLLRPKQGMDPTQTEPEPDPETLPGKSRPGQRRKLNLTG